MGPLAKGETTLAAGLLGPAGMLGEGTLLLADRQFVDANLWRGGPVPSWHQDY